jgi:hypothetical protein
VHVAERALAHFRSQHAVCPRSLAALPDLLAPPVDGWEQPLLFVCPGVHDPAGADVTSAGRDGLFGTADDINSWEL